MAYEKLNIYDGDTLSAEHIRHLEDGIRQIEESVDNLKQNLVTTLNSKDVSASNDEDISEILKKVTYLKSPDTPSYEYTDDIIDITKTVQSKQIQIVALDSGACTGFGVKASTFFTVDWGDGVVEQYSSNNTIIYVKHTYTHGTGQYYDGTDTQFVITIATSSDGLISGWYKYNSNAVNNIVAESASILSFAAKDVFLTSFSFSYMQRIKYIDLIGGSFGDSELNWNINIAFAYSPELERISGNVCWTTVTSMNNAFNGCTKLTTLNLGDKWLTRNCTSFIRTFYNCYSIEEIPEIMTNSAISIEEICYGCKKLKTVNGETWDLTLCEKAFSSFTGCSVLINLPYFANTNTIVDCHNMFSSCTNLVKLNGKQQVFNVDSVITAYGMFAGCSSLEESPFFDFKSATNIACFYWNCTSLYIIQEVFELPQALPMNDKWNEISGNSNGMELMFCNCTSLINAPQIYAPLCKSTKGLFYGCSNLTNVPDRYSFPEGLNATSMFYGCTNLQTAPVIEMPNAKYFVNVFSSSGIKTTNYADSDQMYYPDVIYANNVFYNCIYLVNSPQVINFPKATNIASFFDGCSSLTTAPEEILIDSASNIDKLFYNCQSMETAPKKISAISATSAKSLFEGCINMKNAPDDIIIPEALNIQSMFYNCKSMVTPPLNGINAPKATNAYDCFRGCASLQAVCELNLPMCKNLYEFYMECNSLKTTIEYNFPNAINLNYFYGYCNLLEEVMRITVSDSTNCSITGFTFSSPIVSIELPEGNITCQSNTSSTYSPVNSSLLKKVNGIWNANGSKTFANNCFSSQYLEGTITIKNLIETLTLNNKPYLTGLRLIDPSANIGNLTVTNCALSGEALNDLFNDLPIVSTTRVLNIKGNPGISDCDKSIAINKNWSVVTA